MQETLSVADIRRQALNGRQTCLGVLAVPFVELVSQISYTIICDRHRTMIPQ